MHHNQFLTQIIDRGIAAARMSYAKPRNARKLAGSVSGFEACRNKSIDELKHTLECARIATRDALAQQHDDYWWFRCYALEVEWVCNCVSAVLYTSGQPTIIRPTARGVQMAAEVLGVKGGSSR